MRRYEKNQTGIARIYIVVSLVVATIILFIVGTLRNSDRGLGTGQEYSPPDGPAIMQKTEALYRTVGNDAQFTALRADLAVFARASIEKYKSGKVVDVVFESIDEPAVEDATIRFEGKFKESKDVVSVVLTKKNNDRIHTSITNKKSGYSTDTTLPSNTKRNQYIGDLPIKKDSYSVSYLKADDSFLITMTVNDPTIQTAALQELRDGLGVSNLSEESVSLLAWGANGLPVSLPNPDKPLSN